MAERHRRRPRRLVCPFIDGSKISAEFKDGMLMVMLPKTATAIPKQIEVTVK